MLLLRLPRAAALRLDLHVLALFRGPVLGVLLHAHVRLAEHLSQLILNSHVRFSS
jgi:hypothetical protein